MGGTRSTYRGNSTSLFNQMNNPPTPDTGGSSGVGGGGGSKKSSSASASTGGIQTGGGSSKGGGGSADTIEKPKVEEQTADVDSSNPPPDVDLEAQFQLSPAWAAFDKRYENASRATYEQKYKDAFTKWIQSQEPSGVKAGPASDVETNYRSGTKQDIKEHIESLKEAVPDELRSLMAERGVKIHVANKAKYTSRWNEYVSQVSAEEQVLADGRGLGDINFFDPETKDIFISTSNPGASRNVVAHELAHAIDAWLLEDHVEVTWRDDDDNDHTYWVLEISRDDPDWIFMHDNFVITSPEVPEYYRGGPSGVDPDMGRSEAFAEGLAFYFEDGRDGLLEFMQGVPAQHREFVVDTMIAVWQRYGII